MRVFAIFHDANYAPSHGAESIEVHASVADAIESLRERYSANGRRTITTTYADGHTDETHWPGVNEGDGLTLYRAPSEGVLNGWAAEDPDGVTDYRDGTDGERTWEEAVAAWKRDALASAAEEAVGLSSPVGVVELTARGAVRRAQR